MNVMSCPFDSKVIAIEVLVVLLKFGIIHNWIIFAQMFIIVGLDMYVKCSIQFVLYEQHTVLYIAVIVALPCCACVYRKKGHRTHSLSLLYVIYTCPWLCCGLV